MTVSNTTQALIELLTARDAAGLKKYGTTLDRGDLTHAEWLQHMAEELLDAAGYALAAKRKDAELQDALERARYWKQRAKSAEGHLFTSDMDAAAKGLHSFSRLKDVAWDDLLPQDRIALHVAAARVIAAVNGCREARNPGRVLQQVDGENAHG